MSMDIETINKFAAAWYLGLDQHAPEEALAVLVADDVEMVFPEATLHGVSDFLAWYRGGNYSNGDKAPGVINIFFDENHNVVSVEPTLTPEGADVKIVVAWQASWFVPPAAKSKRTSLDAIQTWKLRPSTKNPFGIEVAAYNAIAAPFVYTPGFSRL